VLVVLEEQDGQDLTTIRLGMALVETVMEEEMVMEEVTEMEEGGDAVEGLEV